MPTAAAEAEVRRIHARYLVEVVEAFDLCPWARAARQNGEVALEVLWGTPTDEDWIAAARRALARPTTRVAMVTAPQLAIDSIDLHDLRNRVQAAVPDAGVAEFLPRATLDLGTPARLVRYLRNAPDPLLQLVPLALLATVRGPPQTADRALQAALLSGEHAPLRGDVADDIAATNHRRVTRDREAVVAALASIYADRDESYARVGVQSGPAARVMIGE